MMNTVPRWVGLTFGLLVAAVAMVMPSAADQSELPASESPPGVDSTPASAASDQASAAAPAAGMLAFRDPVTGRLRPPTEAELEALRPQLEALFNQSSEGLREIVREDGSVGLDLQGRFQTAVVAVVAEDGSVTTSCVTSPQEIEGLLTVADPTKPTEPAGRGTTAVK